MWELKCGKKKVLAANVDLSRAAVFLHSAAWLPPQHPTEVLGLQVMLTGLGRGSSLGHWLCAEMGVPMVQKLRLPWHRNRIPVVQKLVIKWCVNSVPTVQKLGASWCRNW